MDTPGFQLVRLWWLTGFEWLAAMTSELVPWSLAAAGMIGSFRALSSTWIDGLLDRSSRMCPCTEH